MHCFSSSFSSLRHFFRWYDFTHDHHPPPPTNATLHFKASHRHKLKIFGAVSCSSRFCNCRNTSLLESTIDQEGELTEETQRGCLLVFAWETGSTSANPQAHKLANRVWFHSDCNRHAGRSCIHGASQGPRTIFLVQFCLYNLTSLETVSQSSNKK